MGNEIKDIYQLKKEADLLNSKDNLIFIKFFETNKQSVEAIDINIDDAHYDAKLYLTAEYGLSLNGAGQHSKAVSILEKVVPMFENAPSIDSTQLKEVTYFEHILWNYGTALWETKQVKRSHEVFKKLVQYHPENDKYKKWLNGLKENKLSKYSKPIWVALGIWLLCDITVFEKLNENTQFILSIVGGILLILVLGFEFYVYVMKKRMHNTMYVS